jgi:hypothetical protein
MVFDRAALAVLQAVPADEAYPRRPIELLALEGLLDLQEACIKLDEAAKLTPVPACPQRAGLCGVIYQTEQAFYVGTSHLGSCVLVETSQQDIKDAFAELKSAQATFAPYRQSTTMTYA